MFLSPSNSASMRVAALSLASWLLAGCTADAPVAPSPSVGATEPLTAKQGTTSGRILLGKTVAGVVQLFSMNGDGGDVLRLTTTFSAGISSGSWAPDGKRILFSGRVTGTDPLRLYTMNQDGSGITPLSGPPLGCNDILPTSLGKRIAFIESCGAAHTLVIMNANGTGRTVLETGVDQVIASSPKGTQVAYMKSMDLWVLDVASGASTNLTAALSFPVGAPAFSPSGKLIAFVGFVAGTGNILFVMNNDGTHVTPLFVTDKSVVLPKWSPDGTKIVFGSDLDGAGFDLFVISANGAGLTNITPASSEFEIPFAWAR